MSVTRKKSRFIMHENLGFAQNLEHAMAGLASSPNAVWPKEERVWDPQVPYMRKGHPGWAETP